MIEQEPDLESLLELPLAGGENKPLNIKAIRRQAEQAFQGADFEWGYAREIKRDLNPLLKLAAGYLARNDPENSALIYETVIETILDNENAALGDEEGELLGVVYECAEALGNCLSQIKDSKKRLEILQILFSAYQWDTIKIGGVGAADCVPEILDITNHSRRTQWKSQNGRAKFFRKETVGAMAIIAKLLAGFCLISNQTFLMISPI